MLIDIATINGTSNNDFLFGTSLSDVIFGGDGNDMIFGGDGDDIIADGEGFDMLFGGSGDDVFRLTDNNRFGPTTLFNPVGLSPLNGGPGNDTVDAREAITSIHLASSVFAIASIEVFIGSIFDDIVDATGTPFGTILLGGDGNDTFIGGLGDDQLMGEAGNDFLEGGFGADVLTGGRNLVAEVSAAGQTSAMQSEVEDPQILGSEPVQQPVIPEEEPSQIQETDTYSLPSDLRPQNPFQQEAPAPNEPVDGLQATPGESDQSPISLTGSSNELLTSDSNQPSTENGSDPLTEYTNSDIFSFPDLAHSLLLSHDIIADLEIGIDQIDGPNAVTADNLLQLGDVNSLTELDISAVLTQETLVPLGAATFTVMNSRTFLALNDEIAGFQAGSDAVIELTGYNGVLTDLEIV